MDQLNQFIDLLRAERAVITGAPLLSAVLLLLGVIVGWLAGKYLYEERLSAKDATIVTKDATIELLNATMGSYREQAAKMPIAPAVSIEEPPLRPTVEMLEAGRLAQQAQIKEWRQMVAFANHYARQPGVTDTAIVILESDPRFMSLRPRLSERTKQALRGKLGDDSEESHTMLFALRCVLDDIDKFEHDKHLA